MDKQMMGMCGAYCGTCEWKEKTNCEGCQSCQSHVFWGTCEVAKCAISKGYTHCGECDQLPCELLQSFFDNGEHGDNGERLANLKAWARGEEAYIMLGTIK